MNSSSFSYPYHFSLAGIIKLSNLDFLAILSTTGLSSSSILFATLVLIPLYAIILVLHAKVTSSGRTPSTEGVSRRGAGQKSEAATTAAAPVGGIQEDELSVAKETNFPVDWWANERQFRAEKRAIFSKSWLYATHNSRFKKPGDYLSFELATFPIFLILGKDHQLRAFHNVCRHRAYPVIRKAKGSSTVVACRYHGWTYNATGALVKAPQFESVQGFDTSRNGLFGIDLHITGSGLVFVNFDASIDGPAVRFQDWYEGVREQVETLGLAKNGGYAWSQSWVTEGNFNWKAVISLDDSGSNIPGSLAQQEASSSSSSSVFLDFMRRCISRTTTNLPAPTYKRANIPPVTVLAAGSNRVWYSINIVPLSVGKTALVYDVYCKPGGTEGEGEVVALKERSRNAVQGFEARWKSGGELGFRQFEERLSGGLRNMENEHQTHILSLLQSHLKLEKAAGGEIYPASAGARFMGTEGIEAELVCKELDRCNTAGEGFDGNDNTLAW